MLIRSLDGQLLIVSSSDGFCSIVSFSKDELGVPYTTNSKIEMMEMDESVLQDDSEEILNEKTPRKSKLKEEKQSLPDMGNTKAEIQGLVTQDIKEITNEEISMTFNHKEEKQSSDLSELPTKKRVQLVTLSSPKTKKNLNK